MLISVTQAHIDNGKRGNCEQCPIALALRDAGIQNAIVYNTKIAFETYSVRLPDAAFMFIWKVDHEKPVEPFEFEIDIEPYTEKGEVAHG